MTDHYFIPKKILFLFRSQYNNAAFCLDRCLFHKRHSGNMTNRLMDLVLIGYHILFRSQHLLFGTPKNVFKMLYEGYSASYSAISNPYMLASILFSYQTIAIDTNLIHVPFSETEPNFFFNTLFEIVAEAGKEIILFGNTSCSSNAINDANPTRLNKSDFYNQLSKNRFPNCVILKSPKLNHIDKTANLMKYAAVFFFSDNHQIEIMLQNTSFPETLRHSLARIMDRGLYTGLDNVTQPFLIGFFGFAPILVAFFDTIHQDIFSTFPPNRIYIDCRNGIRLANLFIDYDKSSATRIYPILGDNQHPENSSPDCSDLFIGWDNVPLAFQSIHKHYILTYADHNDYEEKDNQAIFFNPLSGPHVQTINNAFRLLFSGNLHDTDNIFLGIRCFCTSARTVIAENQALFSKEDYEALIQQTAAFFSQKRVA